MPSRPLRHSGRETGHQPLAVERDFQCDLKLLFFLTVFYRLFDLGSASASPRLPPLSQRNRRNQDPRARRHPCRSRGAAPPRGGGRPGRQPPIAASADFRPPLRGQSAPNRARRTLRPHLCDPRQLEVPCGEAQTCENPWELHRQPLAEPSVRLSPHSAPIRQTCRSSRSASARRVLRCSLRCFGESGSRGSDEQQSA